jgi:hypothetical protein
MDVSKLSWLLQVWGRPSRIVKIISCRYLSGIVVTALFAFVFSTLLAQSSIPPLERVVSLSFQNERIDDALKKISEQAGVSFSYNSRVLDGEKTVTKKFTNKTIREVLEFIFEGTLQYKQRGNYIILTKLPQTPTEILISGYVVDESTGEKLKEVSIYDPISLRSAVTDEYGFFKIQVDKPSADDIQLAIQKRSYTDTLIVVPTKRSSFQNISLNLNGEKWRVFSDSLDNKFNRLWRWTQHSAQRFNMQNIRDTIHRTWQVSFVPFVGTNNKLSGNVTNDYSLNILGGYSAGTHKAEFGGLFNIDRGDVSHIQMAGLFNLNGGRTSGAQFAGLMNFNLRSSEGAQFAGLLNNTIGSYTGVQFAGLFNFVTLDVKGTQAAGLFNTTVQSIEGAQVAGLFNVSLREVRGVQIAGLLNVANKVRGSQVGFLNVADSVSGVPVGVLSFVNKGYHKIEIAADEIFPVHVSLRTGVRKFYNIITVGVRPEPADTVTWSFGYGIGTAPKLSEKLFLNIDITANEVLKGDIDKLNLVNKLYLGVDYQIKKKLSITAGATLNFRVYNADFTNHAKLFTYYTPTIFSEGGLSHTTNYQMWWGGKVGIRFL